MEGDVQRTDPIKQVPYRRKSLYDIQSTKQNRLDSLYPTTIVQHHVTKWQHRQRMFKKMSDILLKHTSVIRYLNFWSKTSQNSYTNPILVLRKLKEEARLYREMNALLSQQEEVKRLEEDINKLESQIRDRDDAISETFDDSDDDSLDPIRNQRNIHVLTMMKQSTRNTLCRFIQKLPSLSPLTLPQMNRSPSSSVDYSPKSPCSTSSLDKVRPYLNGVKLPKVKSKYANRTLHN